LHEALSLPAVTVLEPMCEPVIVFVPELRNSPPPTAFPTVLATTLLDTVLFVSVTVP
jgi:hypothetical protein